jgi:hypothetical protein
MQVARYIRVAFYRNIQQARARGEEFQGDARHGGYQACSKSLSSDRKGVERTGTQDEHHRRRTFQEEYREVL